MELNAKINSQQESYSQEIDGLKVFLMEKENVVQEKEEMIRVSKMENDEFIKKINQFEEQEKNLKEMLANCSEALQSKVCETDLFKVFNLFLTLFFSG